MATRLAPDTVAALLGGRETRLAALDALEAEPTQHDAALALAAAPALTDILCLSEEEVAPELFQRAALMRARLVAEAADPPAVCGAGWSGGRFARFFGAEANVVANMMSSKPATALTRSDVLCLACEAAVYTPAYVFGWERLASSCGFSSANPFGEWIAVFNAGNPLLVAKAPDDTVPGAVAALLFELLRGGDLPARAAVGAWFTIQCCLIGRPSLGGLAMELDVFSLAAEHMRAAGRAEDWLSITRGNQLAFAVLGAVNNTNTTLASAAGPQQTGPDQDQTVQTRPDQALLISSGLLDMMLEAVVVFAALEERARQDVDPGALCMALFIIRNAMRVPAAASKIRSVGKALAFCMEHSLALCETIGLTTGAGATTM